ncbi:MAG: ABC transporter permease subunit [Planctomycetia bacterium]|nr:ABC transporter permease subunit [Planctomycetia bacterium]
MPLSLLGYRSWKGKLGGSWRAIWPISRVSLMLVFRQKLYWVLYVLALMTFFVFFFGIYLFSQIDPETMTPQRTGVPGQTMSRFFVDIKNTIQKDLKLSGDIETYRNFYVLQGYYVMVVLALAGSLIIGNDYRYGSLAFYLSKPMGHWHYLMGKILAVAIFSMLMTLVPALVLYLECSMLMEEGYFENNLNILRGITWYGLAIALVLGILVVTLASAVRRTAPLVMIWIALLAICPVMGNLFVDRLGYSPNWRLIDLWNDLYVFGSWCLNITPVPPAGPRGMVRRQPELLPVVIVLSSLMIVCVIYLHRKIRAVEVVT